MQSKGNNIGKGSTISRLVIAIFFKNIANKFSKNYIINQNKLSINTTKNLF